MSLHEDSHPSTGGMSAMSKPRVRWSATIELPVENGNEQVRVTIPRSVTRQLRARGFGSLRIEVVDGERRVAGLQPPILTKGDG